MARKGIGKIESDRNYEKIFVLVIIIIICAGCSNILSKESVIIDEQTIEAEGQQEISVQSEKEEETINYEQETDKIDEESDIRVNSISQLDISGRTAEETELIKGILSENEKEFEAFLMEDWEYPHILEWIEILGFDFTGDGEDEIIVSKCDVNLCQTISCNSVYNSEGKKLLEFVGGGFSGGIIRGWDGDGTFLLYDANHYGADLDANIFTEIRWGNGVLEEQVKLIEYDTRDSVAMTAGNDGYYILKNLTKEEEEKLWEGAFGLGELIKTKEYVWKDKDLDEYKRLFDSTETTNVTYIDNFFYSENDGFLKYQN